MKTGVVAACRSVQQNEHVAFEPADAAPGMGSLVYRREDDRGRMSWVCAVLWRSSALSFLPLSDLSTMVLHADHATRHLTNTAETLGCLSTCGPWEQSCFFSTV